LTLLSTRAQLLRRRLRTADADPETLRTSDQLVADTQRLATILDDLLLAADPAAANPSEPVDLARLATEVVAEAEPAASERSIRITGPGPAPADPAIDTTVRGSPTALRRAIIALVDNGVRHAGQSVEVSVRRAGRQVVLEVADDGAGVDQELASRLFDRFVSARPADTGGRRHYGLGLALVSDILASHGGTVELAAYDRPGTVFRLTLPAPRNRSRIRRRAQRTAG
jgi:signal transduction histidine kinase